MTVGQRAALDRLAPHCYIDIPREERGFAERGESFYIDWTHKRFDDRGSCTVHPSGEMDDHGSED